MYMMLQKYLGEAMPEDELNYVVGNYNLSWDDNVGRAS